MPVILRAWLDAHDSKVGDRPGGPRGQSRFRGTVTESLPAVVPTGGALRLAPPAGPTFMTPRAGPSRAARDWPAARRRAAVVAGDVLRARCP